MHDDTGITLITCSGISNTGKLTAKVGEEIVRRWPGLVDLCLSARCDPGYLREVLSEADQIVVLDGCTDCCGRKKVQEHGYEADIHLIATENGIVKNGMEDPRFDEIEKISAIMREMIR